MAYWMNERLMRRAMLKKNRVNVWNIKKKLYLCPRLLLARMGLGSDFTDKKGRLRTPSSTVRSRKSKSTRRDATVTSALGVLYPIHYE